MGTHKAVEFSEATDARELLGMLVGLCSATRFWDGMNGDYPCGEGVFRDDVAREIVDSALARLAELKEAGGVA